MRLGYVGLGWATRAFHLPSLEAIPGVVLAGGCDSSAEQRDSWERETDTKAFSSVAEMLEGARPDVVVIATPPDSHADLCVQALEAGCHVFCEKPFVPTVQEADRVLAAATSAGRSIAVNHEFREKPFLKALKQQIGSDAAGRLVFCQVWQLMDLAPWSEPVAWRAAMQDRTLLEGGVHLVDLLLFLFDARPEAVYARRSGGLDPERGADAIQLITLEFPEGRLAQITINRLCTAATRYLEVRADCERASLRASEGGRATIQIGKKRAERTGVRLDYAAGGLSWMEQGLRRRTVARNPRNPGAHATGELLKGVVAALQDGKEPPSSGREARAVIAVIEAAYRSARTGERVELDWEPVPPGQPMSAVNAADGWSAAGG